MRRRPRLSPFRRDLESDTSTVELQCDSTVRSRGNCLLLGNDRMVDMIRLDIDDRRPFFECLTLLIFSLFDRLYQIGGILTILASK